MNVPTILVLESDPQLRDGLVDVFRRQGYIAWGCSREPLALRFLRRRKPDFLMAEISSGDYAEAACLVTQWKEASPDTSLILASSMHDHQLLELAMDIGAKAFLIKPFLIEPLLGLIAEHTFLSKVPTLPGTIGMSPKTGPFLDL